MTFSLHFHVALKKPELVMQRTETINLAAFFEASVPSSTASFIQMQFRIRPTSALFMQLSLFFF